MTQKYPADHIQHELKEIAPQWPDRLPKSYTNEVPSRYFESLTEEILAQMSIPKPKVEALPSDVYFEQLSYKLLSDEPPVKILSPSPWKILAYAASVLTIASLGFYGLTQNEPDQDSLSGLDPAAADYFLKYEVPVASMSADPVLGWEALDQGVEVIPEDIAVALEGLSDQEIQELYSSLLDM